MMDIKCRCRRSGFPRYDYETFVNIAELPHMGDHLIVDGTCYHVDTVVYDVARISRTQKLSSGTVLMLTELNKYEVDSNGFASLMNPKSNELFLKIN